MARKKYKFNTIRVQFASTLYPVSFPSAPSINATTTDYVLTLNDVNLQVSRFPFIIGETANFNLTINDVELTVSRQFTVAATDFSLILNNVNFTVNTPLFLIVDTVNYDLTLNDVDLIHVHETTFEVETIDFELEIFEPDYILTEALLPGSTPVPQPTTRGNSLLYIGMITRR